MKYIALILGLILPFTLLSCTKAEAQLGANLKYEKIMMDPNCGLTPTATKSTS